MAIRKRLRTDSWYVCRDDDALDEVPPKTLSAYARTYDLALLESYLAEHPECKPTRFRARPLDAKWQRMIETLRPSDLWDVFATHVTAIENLIGDDGREVRVELEGPGVDRVIPNRYRDDGTIPMAVYVEIGGAIVHRGTTADNTPFGSPGTLLEWQRTRGYTSRVRKEDAALLLGFASAKTSQASQPSTSGKSTKTTDPSDESERSTEDGA